MDQDKMLRDKGPQDKNLEMALSQIEKQFGKGSIMRLGEHGNVGDRGHPHRLPGPRPRARHRGPAPGPGGRDLRPGVVGEDHARDARRRRGPAQRRGVRLHRRRARHGSGVRGRDRRRRRRPLHLPARHRRAGARDRRHAHPLGCARRHRDRLGGRARAPGRDRGRDGRCPHGPAGPAHEPGAAQAHRQPQQVAHDLRVHQPAAGEDRRDVRLTRDDPGRAGAEVLLVGAARHPPGRGDQGGRRRSSATGRG